MDSAPEAAPVGTRVEVRFDKFDRTPHWRYDCHLLGTDSFGVWIGAAPGLRFSRPGVEVVCPTWQVNLVSPRGFVLTRYAEGDDVEIYIDLSTVPVWSAVNDTTLRMECSDLDLDVVREFGSSRAWLDDADEFADHQLSMGYPPGLVARTQQTATELLGEVTEQIEPFDQVSLDWLVRCRELLSP